MERSEARRTWRELVANMNTWKDADKRAAHKPLMTLLLLGRADRNEPAEVPYAELDRRLGTLLREFGGPRTRAGNTHYPFLRLQQERVWRVRDEATYQNL